MRGNESGVSRVIRSEIERLGRITFARFMELALYHSDHGYYTTTVGLGEQGDYYTSPELHPYFAAVVAAQAYDTWVGLGSPEQFQIVEVGGGSGRCARDLLVHASSAYPEFSESIYYRIDDRSPRLRSAQRERLGAAGLENRVAWSSGEDTDWQPASIEGLIVANELLDAFAVHLITARSGEVQELYVIERDGSLALAAGPVSSAEITDYLASKQIKVPDDVQWELNLGSVRWIRRAMAALERGALLLMDYGYPRASLYHPDRRQGTLLCYAAHTLGSDPLQRPGQQDITSHIDLDLVAGILRESGVDSIDLRTQADVLVQAGHEHWRQVPRPSGIPWAVYAGMLRSLDALIERQGLGAIWWILATRRSPGSTLSSRAAPLADLTQLDDHLELPDPAGMDPIWDVESQWQELWPGSGDVEEPERESQ